uniref:Uncharacterized protein n=1 Tax=Anguilla anguilla TaxID=7936 RepID=A0A0E9WN57_ANGAN
MDEYGRIVSSCCLDVACLPAPRSLLPLLSVITLVMTKYPF